MKSQYAQIEIQENIPFKHKKPRWTWSWAACVAATALSRGVVLDDLQRSLPTSTFLWFCDSISTRHQQSQTYQKLSNFSTSAKLKLNKEGKRKQVLKIEFIDYEIHEAGIYQTRSFLVFSQCHILQVLSLLPSNKNTLWDNHSAVLHNLPIFVNTYINNLPRMPRSKRNIFLSTTRKRQQDLQQYF